MRCLGILLAAVCCSTYSSCNPIHDHPPHDSPPRWHRRSPAAISRRNIVYDAQIADSYDFVIVGGGAAGLVLASRLSEDTNTTVLVLEAGDTGDLVRNQIDTPGDTYYDGLIGTSYDWQFTTANQPNLGNRALGWPRGKVLGGSTAVNGMYMVRPSQLEYDTWSSLLDDQPGADVWNWTYQEAAMRKAETFTPPATGLQQEFALSYNPDSHETDGPVHVSWPGYMLPVVGNWSQTLAGIGVPSNSDPYGGNTTGAFVALSAINPTNWTRSYARAAYIDPLPPRANLALLPNATVTRIVFDTSNASSLLATAVEFAGGPGDAPRTVKANREVLLAGGAIGSPHVLMHSGVGPKDVLGAASVTMVLELPGVGQHMQDHLAAGVSWTTTTDTMASLRDAGESDAPFLSFVNGAEAYVNASVLFGGPASAATFAQGITDALATSAGTLVPSAYSEVVEGYKAIYTATAGTFVPSALGHVELLLSAQGQKGSTTQALQVQAALQHPFSQGRLYITTSNAFDAPTIDPQYLSHGADVAALRQGLKLARIVGQTPPLSTYLGAETAPGPSVQSDADWETWLRAQVATEYHPANTCAMLPRALGGVVDPTLTVYGTRNVRVIDASVFPMQFSAHLMWATYGLAETGAEIIRAQYNGLPAPGSSPTTGNGSPSATTPGESSTTKKSSASAHRHVPLALSWLVASSVLGWLAL